MQPRIVVVTQEDPRTTHRPVEALRMVLGLSTGGNPLSVILLGPSRILMTDALDEIVDADTFERYLPSLSQLRIPFIVPTGSLEEYRSAAILPITERPLADIASLILDSDYSLVF